MQTTPNRLTSQHEYRLAVFLDGATGRGVREGLLERGGKSWLPYELNPHFHYLGVNSSPWLTNSG